MPELTQKQFHSIVGRNQGPELLDTIAFAALGQPFMHQNVNLNRPLASFDLVWKGRIVIGVAPYTVVSAEAPVNILQEMILRGTHTTYNSQTPIDMTGAMAFVWPRLFGLRGSSCYINGVRQPDPNVPYQQVGATFGNVGTYDVEIHYNIPVTPMMPFSSKLALIPFLYYQKDWRDTLMFQFKFGDLSSFGTPGGGTTVTFSGFGSGAGTPQLFVMANYEILGPIEGMVASALVIRNSNVLTTPMQTSGNNQLIQLLQKLQTANILLKTGSILAGTSAGVQVFQTLSDTILEQTQIIVDTKPVRNNSLNAAQKEYAGFSYRTIMPQGFLNFPFTEGGSPLTRYRGDLLSGGAQFKIVSNVLTSGAQQAAEVVQEEYIGDPDIVAG